VFANTDHTHNEELSVSDSTLTFLFNTQILSLSPQILLLPPPLFQSFSLYMSIILFYLDYGSIVKPILLGTEDKLSESKTDSSKTHFCNTDMRMGSL